MIRKFNFSRQKQKLLTLHNKRYNRGLNTLVSSTQIRADELAEAIDIALIEDGKIQFPRDGQSYYGNENGTKTTGLFPFYKSDGTKELIRISGTTLQKFNTTTNDWDNISGKTYTTGLDTEAMTAHDYLYICNGTESLSYYDGTDITSWSAVATPASPSCTRTGTTGTYTYSYKVTAVSSVGESLPTAAVTDNINVKALDSSSYMTIAWTASTNAIGYNIYGRKNGQWGFIEYVEGNSTVSYIDKGTVTEPNLLMTPPEGDTSAGPVGKYICVYHDCLFIAGDPNNPSRIYYSGGYDQINNFTGDAGGGFVDVSKNDGQKITGMIVFKNSIVIFKERSIYQFSFTTSGGFSVSLITGAVGANSCRSIVLVENDVFFASDNGIYTIGNETGFAIDVLRTNELSAKVRSIFQSMETSRRANVAAVYAKTANLNLVVFAYTPTGGSYNSRALVYDRERLAWYEWTNIQANCWTPYIETDGSYHVLYGDDNGGYIKEILSGSDDFGTALQGKVKLKAESFDSLTLYKKAKDVSVVLRQPTGAVNMSVIVDGTVTGYQSNISTVNPSINWGHYLFGAFLLGESYGTGAITTTDDIVLRTKKNLNLLGKAFQISLNNGSSGSKFVLLEHEQTAKPRSLRWRASTDLI